MIENDENESSLLVQPCLVYLPVKTRVKDSIVARFRLKPVASGAQNKRLRRSQDQVPSDITDPSKDKKFSESNHEEDEMDNHDEDGCSDAIETVDESDGCVIQSSLPSIPIKTI